MHDSQRFLAARPFPHAVFDDFLPPALLLAASSEFDAVPPDAWVHYDSLDECRKRACNQLDAMGPACRQILVTMTRRGAARIARRYAAIDNLQPDPTLYGGGLHVTEPGGWLGVHADNEIHPTTGLMRRLNLIVYCTPGWPKSQPGPGWGGELEFWDSACRHPVTRIDPLFNRAVLFETGTRHYHSHSPVSCDWAKGPRKSLAVYFWSEPRRRARFVQRADEAFDAEREAARRSRCAGRDEGLLP